MYYTNTSRVNIADIGNIISDTTEVKVLWNSDSYEKNEIICELKDCISKALCLKINSFVVLLHSPFILNGYKHLFSVKDNNIYYDNSLRQSEINHIARILGK